MARIYCDGFPLGIKGQASGWFFDGGYTVCDANGLIIKRDWKKFDKAQNVPFFELWAILEAVKLAEDGDEVLSDARGTVMDVIWCQLYNYRTAPETHEMLITARLIIEQKQLLLKWEPREQNLAGMRNEYFPVRKLPVKSNHEVIYFDTKPVVVAPLVAVSEEEPEEENPAWMKHKLDYFERHS